MLPTRLLPERLRHLAPEALAFAVIGAANAVLYFVIFNAALFIGAVKATIIATVITTTISYFANRHWTYRHRPRTALHREYVLFFAFNLAGLIIQSGAVTIGKYGFGLSEDRHRLTFNVLTLFGVALATVFRFWAYRTFVFLTDPTAAISLRRLVRGPARAVVATAPRRPDPVEIMSGEFDDIELEVEIAVELDAAERRPAR
jgi:putative flippase GtrA